MARVRLLSIPAGAERDAEGRGHGDDWGPLADFGCSDDGTHHYLTTDHCHASDLCDDAIVGAGPAELGAFVVEALNSRGWRWVKYDPPPVDQRVLAVADGSAGPVCVIGFRRVDGCGETWHLDSGHEMVPPRCWRELPPLPPPPRPAYVPPEPEPYVHPDPEARECGNCKHWSSVTPGLDVGTCDHPARPWDTPERQADMGHWVAAVDADGECPGGVWTEKEAQ